MSKARILIVDDEAVGRKTLQALLIGHGYDLAFAEDGPEALTKAAELVPDLILLDVMMPGMDGFEVCQRIKSDERWRHIPIILVTALDSKDDLVRGLDAGADDFLPKPVNALELRARVRSMLRIKKQHDELETILHLREDLSHMIVHDMRNPLTAICMTIPVVKQNVTRPKDLKRLDTIETAARRLDSFLNDMLMLAKMQESQLVLNRSQVDVSQIVQTMKETFDGVVQSRGIDLVAELPQETRQVSLDANLFQRVLDNLLSNALKFSPRESRVTLRVEYPTEEPSLQSPQPLVRVQVLDQGSGIAEEHRDRIFDKFEIVALKKGGMPQIGLGLAFCKLAVEAHGGRIFVDANEPDGSIFTVEI